MSDKYLHQVSRLEYIWIDGDCKLRSKTRIVPVLNWGNMGPVRLDPGEAPEWSFDGSSTGQADGGSSDVLLKPVFACPDPLRGQGDYLILCETFDSDGTPNRTNHRRALAELLDSPANAHESVQDLFQPLFGLEQEYVLLRGIRPLGWPEHGYPAPQGPFYCGVGADEVFGREIVEEHLTACLRAGLSISGINAEVMPGQWEFQVGAVGALEVSDHLWVARWLLYRIAENYGVNATLDPKPVKGDWNGSGCHTNFSTFQMRTYTKSKVYKQIIESATEDADNKVDLEVSTTGMDAITEACELIGQRIPEHLAVYGEDNEQRLTGKHETCSIHEFRYGVSDRGASIRIPMHVAQQGYGYLEDRRPAANIDPYQVTRVLIETISGQHVGS
jgi:glutamine synthetase